MLKGLPWKQKPRVKRMLHNEEILVTKKLLDYHLQVPEKKIAKGKKGLLDVGAVMKVGVLEN